MKTPAFVSKLTAPKENPTLKNYLLLFVPAMIFNAAAIVFLALYVSDYNTTGGTTDDNMLYFYGFLGGAVASGILGGLSWGYGNSGAKKFLTILSLLSAAVLIIVIYLIILLFSFIIGLAGGSASGSGTGKAEIKEDAEFKVRGNDIYKNGKRVGYIKMRPDNSGADVYGGGSDNGISSVHENAKRIGYVEAVRGSAYLNSEGGARVGSEVGENVFRNGVLIAVNPQSNCAKGALELFKYRFEQGME